MPRNLHFATLVRLDCTKLQPHLQHAFCVLQVTSVLPGYLRVLLVELEIILLLSGLLHVLFALLEVTRCSQALLCAKCAS
jgi:hypothetical protein